MTDFILIGVQKQSLLDAAEKICPRLKERIQTILTEECTDATIEAITVVLYLVSAAANLQYVQHQLRLSSFPSVERWTQLGNGQPIERFVEAGFFLVEEDTDHVKCFFCNLGLKDWSAGDDPMEEHARFSPFCYHIKSLNGLPYLQEMARRRDSPVQFPAVYSQRTHGGLLERITRMFQRDLAIATISVGIQARHVLLYIARLWIRERKDVSDIREIVATMQAQEDDSVDVYFRPDLTPHVKAFYNFLPDQGRAPLPEAPPRRQAAAPPAAAAAAAAPAPSSAASHESPNTENLNTNSTSSLSTTSSMTIPEPIVTHNKKCRLCDERDFEITCLPCGHLCICYPCYQNAKRKVCPVCETLIQGHVRTFLT